MEIATVVAVCVVGAAAATALLVIKARRGARERSARLKAIDGLVFSEGWRRTFARLHPQLNPDQRWRIEIGLRTWFRCCAHHGPGRLAMPSQAIDAAWHEFILFTAEYRSFCQEAFGRYLDHVPAAANLDVEHDLDRWRRVWQAACAIESIDPQNPARLPSLFSMDADVAWPGGYFWRKDCAAGDGDPRPCIARLLAPAAGGGDTGGASGAAVAAGGAGCPAGDGGNIDGSSAGCGGSGSEGGSAGGDGGGGGGCSGGGGCGSS